MRPERSAAIAATILCLAGLSAQAPAPKSAPLPTDRSAGADSVTEAQIREWLGKLASEDFAGRGTGQEGYRKAAEYVRDHFEALGYEPGAGDSFFQVVPWTRTGPVADGCSLRVKRGDKIPLDVGLDRLRGSASQDTEAAGPLTIVATRTLDGADLDGMDLSGRAVVLALVGDAFDAAGAEDWRARRAVQRATVQLRNKVQQAGGNLVAFAHDGLAATSGSFAESTGPDRRSGGPAAAGRNRAPATVVLPNDTFEDLLQATLGKQRSKAKLDNGEDAVRIDTPTEIALTLDIETSDAPAYNVVAVLPGSDPELRDSYVAIGCHLDHLGVSADGTIHPGADDDGSGSAGLMAIAQAFAKNETRPKRSVLLMAFCGEERGLIGSAYFAANPTVPLASIVAELQIDMIGRDEEKGDETAADNVNCLHLVGSQKLSDDLHQLCLRLNDERAQFDLEWDEEGVFYRSDHWNFAREGVPIAFFFTGFHPDYHRPTDTADKINYAKLRRIAMYVYDIGFELGNADARPLVDAARWESLERKGRQEPVAPVRR
ncbi:MAG: M28 family peptidase [Planctomycetota bacterium]|nr:M28 family peptidase [Planctomycetota bacterium]